MIVSVAAEVVVAKEGNDRLLFLLWRGRVGLFHLAVLSSKASLYCHEPTLTKPARSMPWQTGEVRGKSLLLLFFRKEESSFLKERSKELLLFSARSGSLFVALGWLYRLRQMPMSALYRCQVSDQGVRP
ncbi:MAG TPA: hypothetical protein VMB71_07400 [Acetobacteraceae bacterium]|nr:hypothetical protein [Acetobacteraceae bacterium]